jgi:pimeloyl-ACP methyl ester carboxylesterase
MNTGIAVGRSPGAGFDAWKDYVAKNPDFDIARLMKRSDPKLTTAESDAYAAPFPDARFRAGVRRFPAIVPVTPDMPGADIGRRAAAWWKTEWQGPTFMAVGMQDPVLGPATMRDLRALIRGCPEPLEIEDAGHFVQERGDLIARAALAAWQ